MTPPIETKYGLVIHPDSVVSVGHYPDQAKLCGYDGCDRNGYYLARIEEEGEFIEGNWLCVAHMKELVDLFLSNNEFRRKIS